MNKFLIALLLAVSAGGAFALFRQYTTNAELSAKIATLQQQVEKLGRQTLRDDRADSRKIVADDEAEKVRQQGDRLELTKLREDLTALKTQTQDIARATQAVARGESTIPVKLVPVSAWKNAGKATPTATVETVLWAAAGGDVESVAGAIAFTASAREKADAMFAQQSDSIRAQYGTPEKLFALMIARDAATVSGMQVLGQREMGPDEVGMRVRFGNDEGKTKEDSFLFRRAGDGWRLMLSDAVVDKFNRQLSGGK